MKILLENGVEIIPPKILAENIIIQLLSNSAVYQNNAAEAANTPPIGERVAEIKPRKKYKFKNKKVKPNFEQYKKPKSATSEKTKIGGTEKTKAYADEEKQEIIGLYELGKPVKEIAEITGRKAQTLHAAIGYWKKTGLVKSPDTRPVKLTPKPGAVVADEVLDEMEADRTLGDEEKPKDTFVPKNQHKYQCFGGHVFTSVLRRENAACPTCSKKVFKEIMPGEEASGGVLVDDGDED